LSFRGQKIIATRLAMQGPQKELVRIAIRTKSQQRRTLECIYIHARGVDRETRSVDVEIRIRAIHGRMQRNAKSERRN
jgi:hypothetical protein